MNLVTVHPIECFNRNHNRNRANHTSGRRIRFRA